MEAWVQFQQSRRTFKEARARQAEVRLGRRFYKPGNGKGPGKRKQPIGAGPSGGPCLRCGRNHRTSECNLPKEETKGMQAEELAEYTYYNDQDHDNEKLSETSMDKDNLLRDKFHEQLEEHEAPAALAYSEEAIGAGMAVLDSGATKTMGSIHAVEKLLCWNKEHRGEHGMSMLDREERPTFGFGNSARSQTMSTCYVNVPCSQHPVRMKIHVIPDGQAPILLSIDTMKKLGAIVDYGNDEAIFTSLNDQVIVPLQKSRAGHQLLPLGQDPLRNGRQLARPVRRLSALAE